MAGLATCYLGIRNLELAGASSNWPTVPGVVQSSKVEWHSGDDNSSTATAKVIYTYDVSGHEHSSNNVFYGDYGSSDSSHADSIASQYVSGQQVTVYYEPSEPSNAVLQPGIKGAGWFVPLFGGVFLVVGLALLFFMPKMMAAFTPAPPATDGSILDPRTGLPPTT